ncbi:Mog1p/PsbP-like protein [Russula compacta]|nr:Mog1p/PsbP-like protein [Russula compacta]
MTNLVETKLFGGAIRANFPKGFYDASLIRQVPDTQEVYISSVSDDSIIIEVLERVSAGDSAEAARYHFGAIAHDNDAVSSSVDEVNEIPNNCGDEISSIIVLRGQQGVQKFNRTAVDDVRIFVALYRLKERGVDLVLSLNFPMNTSDGVVRAEEDYNTTKETFPSIATSLRIVDFSLFA